LTEGELLAIASKFVEAHVNGIVFPLVAYDTDALKRDVGLTVGEAVLFVHTMEKLSALVEGFTQAIVEIARILSRSTHSHTLNKRS
jgi:hypothetical protein